MPWLLDTLDDVGQAGFDTYVGQHSVLVRFRVAARRYEVGASRPWVPRLPGPRSRRLCPLCSTEEIPILPLTAGLPLMLSCPKHGCQLQPESGVRFAQLIGEPLAIVRSTEAVVALDRRTWEGLTSGQVALPRPTVHVGVWLRLLRRLLHELSQPLSRLGRAQSAGKTVWQAIDQPVRAGMGIWRPYEQLEEERQHALLEAAAVTLALIEAGKIDARGTSAPLLMPDLHNEVYAGDPPDPKSPRTDGRRRKSTH